MLCRCVSHTFRPHARQHAHIPPLIMHFSFRGRDAGSGRAQTGTRKRKLKCKKVFFVAFRQFPTSKIHLHADAPAFCLLAGSDHSPGKKYRQVMSVAQIRGMNVPHQIQFAVPLGFFAEVLRDRDIIPSLMDPEERARLLRGVPLSSLLAPAKTQREHSQNRQENTMEYNFENLPPFPRPKLRKYLAAITQLSAYRSFFFTSLNGRERIGENRCSTDAYIPHNCSEKENIRTSAKLSRFLF